jgi:hypothetical protein
MEENMQINQQTVDKLIGHALLTTWEKGFIESVSDQLKRGRTLSSNQERVVNRCETPRNCFALRPLLQRAGLFS